MNAEIKTIGIQRYRFNVEQYSRMAEAGIVPRGSDVELLEGVVMDLSPTVGNRCHPSLKGGVTRFLNEVSGLDTEFDTRIHKYTFDEYHEMGEAGIFKTGDRVELIDGEIVLMPPIGSSHAAGTARCTRIFTMAVGERAIVWAQNPVHLPDGGEPEPDIALIRPRPDYYQSSLPASSDVLLAVEVSDTTARFDRSVKVPLYALNGIRETWLLLLSEETIEVFRDPGTEGYQRTMRFHRGESLSPEAIPDLQFSVDELLGLVPIADQIEEP